jgi:hypothetical protein
MPSLVEGVVALPPDTCRTRLMPLTPLLRHFYLSIVRSCWMLGLATSVYGQTTQRLDELQLRSIFAFDQVSIPFQQNLKLEMETPLRHPANPVLDRGPAGSVDAMGVQFYGSILREDDRYRMWYVAFDDDVDNRVASARWRPAYAESRDGLHWEKPNLGLVEFRGSRLNNLIRTDPAGLGMINLKVLRDDDDANPQQRYKISSHVYFRHQSRLGSLAPFVSPDGLRWKLLSDAQPHHAELKKADLFLPAIHFEPCGGLYRWNGMFYACGQNAMQAIEPLQGRVARAYRSPDFLHWSTTSHVQFLRDAQYTYLGPGRSLEGEQTHEGISVWNRRNVLLGIYGQWHGAKEWKDITVDLGFVISNDGLNLREPKREWVFLKRGEDGSWDQGGLLQGQGFENIGDKTYFYYGAWDPRVKNAARGGVGIAMLDRDRFGALQVDERAQGPGDYQMPKVDSECITNDLPLELNQAPTIFINADGLGSEAQLRIELLTTDERPIAGFSGRDAAIVNQSGFQVPVIWPNGNLTNKSKNCRIRLSFQGPRRTDIHFYAMYLAD